MAIFIPRWGRFKDKKPSGPVEINWNNGLATNLVGATSDFKNELVRNSLIVTNGSYNNADLYHTSTSHFTEIEQTTDSILPKGKVSILIGYNKSDTTNRDSAAFGLPGAQTTARCVVHLPYSDGVCYWDFGGQISGTNRLSVASLNISNDNWAFISSPSSKMEIWQNGILKASNTGGRTRTTGTTKFTLGKAEIAISDLASYKYIYIFNNVLSDLEIKDINTYPYQLLKPRNNFFFLGSANGTADIALTTVNPTIAIGASQLQHADVAITTINPTIAAGLSQELHADVAITTINPTIAATVSETVVLARPITPLSGNAPTLSFDERLTQAEKSGDADEYRRVRAEQRRAGGR